jgi:hypothetical protein
MMAPAARDLSFLPAVPEGQLWRISPAPLGMFRIELRKTMRWGSRRLGERFGWETELSNDWLHELATRILDEREATRIRYRDDHPFYGEHPGQAMVD